MPDISIGRYRGGLAVVWRDETGKRRRHRLRADNLADARREALDVWRRETAPRTGLTVADLWAGYLHDRAGRPIVATMAHTWRALEARFGPLRPDQITVETCREHVSARRRAGIRDGTLHTELGHLAIVCGWAAKRRLIERAPYVERPPKPAPRDRWLTEAEIDLLLRAEMAPHVRLAIVLMLGTAARVGAVLDLTWDRVDLEAGRINLRLPDAGTRKGRAVLPMNRMTRAALEAARAVAVTGHVVEWGGRPVASIKKGFRAAVASAGLEGVTPHVLRHSAAVHMAAAGVSMDRIAQYLGHADARITARVYARFSPDHLADAAAAVDFGGLRAVQ